MLTVNEVERIVTDYLTYRNYSPNTIHNYLGTLRRFNRYLIAKKRPEDFREIKEADLFNFLEYHRRISKNGLRKNGQNSYICSMKVIFQILMEEEKILANPFNDIPYIKTPKSIRDKILTEEEIKTIMESFDESKPLEVRDKAIISLLYGTGLRVNELLSLELQDVIKEEKLLFIRQGKGKKDRVLPLGDMVFTVMLNYLEKVRPKLAKKKAIRYIFIHNGIKKMRSLRVVLKKVREKTGMKKNLNAHMFRHTFSTHLLNNGADIREVQLLLGHTSLKTTAVYLNLTVHHLKEGYTKYHPLENELYFDVYGRESYILDNGFEAGIKLVSKKNLTEN